MTLQTGKIYKVKEGHEGKCFYYRAGKGSYIQIIDKNNKDEYFFKILDDNKEFLNVCDSCFTEDDLELEEEEKEEYTQVLKCNHCGQMRLRDDKFCDCEFGKQKSLEEEVKEKSLEDLEVRRDWKKMLEDINELVDNDFGFDLQFDEKEYTDKDVDKMRKIILSTYQISHCVYCKSCQNKYKYQISKQMSPSEAETLLEEKLGIKVKIK